MYIYRSPVGTFSIKYHNGKYQLWIKDMHLGSYNSAVSAADDVYTHTTGYYEWDCRPDLISDPSDLSEWQIVSHR